MAPNRLLQRLGIEHPIILGPMAGGPSTPELVAAVSNAGGLGSLGAGYLSPERLSEAIRQIKLLTDRPFSVNLFAGGYQTECPVDPRHMLQILAEVHDELKLPPPSLPDLGPDPFPDQFEVVLEERPAAFSFTFGIPDHRRLEQLRERGIRILGTATSADEAHLLAKAAVDGIVVQGEQAGAHRGTFEGPFEEAMVPTLELLRQSRSEVSVPLIAAGGIMDGRDVAEALTLGACAAQLGTAFLCCPESGASQAYKLALLMACEDSTEITRVFSGRPARGLRNRFMAQLEGCEEDVLPYPVQNALTRPMRSAAAERGDAGFLSLWAGRGVTRIRVMPAAALVRRLVEELEEKA